jgi:phthiocerol/phenolphthiocerol synthesis type-I polyketide synthase E
MSTEVAVVGVSGRFPGAEDVDSFWSNLCNGVESIAVLSDEEIRTSGIPRELAHNPSFVRVAAVLDGVGEFDASFFGYSPREAEILDPQQRLFLEACWNALESSGYASEKYDGSIGVYAGVGSPLYLFRNLLSDAGLIASMGEDQIWMGSAVDHLATRVSYKLNLTGPSLTIQTACSTSLVAVHIACQDLLTGSCDLALAGGVSISSLEKSGYLYEEGYKLSRDGHCRTFDARASGTVPGSGVGVLALKRLGDALRDRDSILAVVRGSAINNDGGRKLGYTAPSIAGQTRVILEALGNADVSAESITYVEAHGTATELGDPVEMEALSRAFRQHSNRIGYCAIGSVKTNIGHADAAAGVIGAIKTVLALKHRMLPPSLHFELPNPKIDFANSPFFVNTKLAAWKSNGTPRRAGVSSFGIGGTNAHVILEEAPETVGEPKRTVPAYLLPLSAKTDTALKAAKLRLSNYCSTHPQTHIGDIAFTLQAGRKEFSHRWAMVGSQVADVAQTIGACDNVSGSSGQATTAKRPIAFLFPGGGAQHPGMAAEIRRHFPVFEETLARCTELVQHHTGIDVRASIYSEVHAGGNLEMPTVALTSLLSVEIALARTWQSLGIHPRAMIGHSAGEYAAAYLAGVFSLEDVIRVITFRGQLFEKLPPGAMLSVAAPADKVRPLLGEDLALAAMNAPNLCVVSGTISAIDRLHDLLKSEGIEGDRLHIRTAAHSPMIDELLEPFRRELGRIELRPPTIPFVSGVTGTWITPERATDPEYWCSHLRQPVMFANGIETLVGKTPWTLLEVGPGNVLSTFARQRTPAPAPGSVLNSLPHVSNRQGDYEFLLSQIARLWSAGYDIRWDALPESQQHRRIALPTYPFERRRCWVERNERPTVPRVTRSSDIQDWTYVPSWMRSSGALSGEIGASSYLLFADPFGVMDELAGRLRSRGNCVVVVRAGQQDSRSSEDECTVDPEHPDGYYQLLSDRRIGNRVRILHAWNLDFLPPESNPKRLFAPFESFVLLAQILGARTMPSELFVISNGMHDVLGNGSISPPKALLLGPSLTIPKEFSHISCRCIDFEPTQRVPGQDNFVINCLQQELSAPVPDEMVAYAGGRRWLPCFERVRIPRARESVLRTGGVYLITGGLGGIGLQLAEHLARKFRAKTILVGRSAHSDDPRLETLRRLGAEFQVSSADVSSEPEMRTVISEAQNRFGSIHGVIHAAGAKGGGLLAFKATEDLAALKSKVLGTLVLDEILRNEPLDFTLLCSSLATVIGPPGQAEYISANAFLDAFALQDSILRGRRTVAIDWDLWRGVGMAATANLPPELQAMHERNVLSGMSPSEAVELFELVLSSQLPRLILSTKDLPALYEQCRGIRLDNPRTAPPGISVDNRDGAGLTVEGLGLPGLEADLEQIVAGIWHELIGIEGIGRDDNFFEIGGHSLLATRLIARVRERFKVQIPFKDFFNRPTIRELAGLVGQLLIRNRESVLENALDEVALESGSDVIRD